MSTKGMEYLAYRRTIEPLMDSYRDLLSGADFVYLTFSISWGRSMKRDW